MAFIGLNIAMGIINCSDVRAFRSTDPILSHPWFPSIMSRDRFLQILSYLHLNNNNNNAGNDKLFKVRPFLDHLGPDYMSRAGVSLQGSRHVC